jgi:hypothetical protein
LPQTGKKKKKKKGRSANEREFPWMASNKEEDKETTKGAKGTKVFVTPAFVYLVSRRPWTLDGPQSGLLCG